MADLSMKMGMGYAREDAEVALLAFWAVSIRPPSRIRRQDSILY